MRRAILVVYFGKRFATRLAYELPNGLIYEDLLHSFNSCSNSACLASRETSGGNDACCVGIYALAEMLRIGLSPDSGYMAAGDGDD